MTDLRTAAQQALKILELEGWGYPSPKTAEAITALKAALAEPVQEPFALPCPTPKACKAHCCSGQCIPRAALAEPTPLEDVVTHGSAWSKDGKRIDPMSVYAEPVEPVAWYHVPYPNNGISPMVSLSQQREPSLYGASVPLYLKEQL